MRHLSVCLLLFFGTLLLSACGNTEFSGSNSDVSAKASDGSEYSGPPISVLESDPSQADQYPCGDSSNPRKIEICHVPEGNPANRHTLCLPPPAVEAHLREHDASPDKGDEDHLGACK